MDPSAASADLTYLHLLCTGALLGTRTRGGAFVLGAHIGAGHKLLTVQVVVILCLGGEFGVGPLDGGVVALSASVCLVKSVEVGGGVTSVLLDLLSGRDFGLHLACGHGIVTSVKVLAAHVSLNILGYGNCVHHAVGAGG
jgi:hypothetical protein